MPRKLSSDLSKTNFTRLSWNSLGRAITSKMRFTLLQQRQRTANESCMLFIEAAVMYFGKKRLKKLMRLGLGDKRQRNKR